MKYYEYISDTKVDMILPQVPFAQKQKISKEVGFDIKVLTAKFKTENTAYEDRISRLLAVASYISADQRVGDLKSPESWVADKVIAKVGYFARDTKVVGFAGISHDVHFLLAGSSSHIIGADPKEASIGKGFSFLPRLTAHLKSVLHHLDNNDVDENDSHIKMELGCDESDTKQGSWMKIIEKSRYDIAGDVINIEFLAKRLLFLNGNRGKYLLATPLYIARVD
jgi:hypothetical protein